MPEQNNQSFSNNPETRRLPEKKNASVGDVEHYNWERDKNVEKKGESPYSRIVSDEIRQEIEKMELDDSSRMEAEKKAEKIEFLGEKEKVEHLLQLAKDRGVVFAVQVARKMNEPYLLDILHDTLAKEGYYKDFSK